MWSLSNTTPFPAHVAAFRDHNGASFWAVWIKASFTLRAGRPALFLADQPPLVMDPIYHNDDPNDALIADSDLAQPKPAVDVIVNGHVIPNRDGTARDLSVAVGDWRKTLSLHPPQRQNWRGAWVPDKDAPVSPIAFHALPVVDEAVEKTSSAGLRYSDEKPAFFGAIAPTSPVRAQYGGTYDAAWLANRAPLLPADFDPLFWQAAPEDQRLQRPLADDATLELSGLMDQPASCPLPMLDLHVATKIAGVWQPQTAALQTIAIDVDRMGVGLTYMAAWPIAAASQDVEIEATTVQLNRFDSFRVAGSDAALFPRHRTKSEVA